jgi:hypothetical protein
MIGAVARTAGESLLKTSIHERGNHEQNDRDGHLSADQ